MSFLLPPNSIEYLAETQNLILIGVAVLFVEHIHEDGCYSPYGTPAVCTRVSFLLPQFVFFVTNDECK